MSGRSLILPFFLLLAGWTVQAQEAVLRSAVVSGDGYLAAGDCLAWLDERGVISRTRTVQVPLVALVSLGGSLYAADSSGRDVLQLDASGDVLSRTAPAVRGRIRSLATDGRELFGVTDAGEFIRSRDARSWQVLDFNAEYAGYYPRMDFRAVAAGGGALMVAGVDVSGHLAVFTSSRGTVWAERSLDYRDQGQSRLLDTVPLSLSYDPVQDSFCLTGGGGVLFSMPGCSHCNRLVRYPVDTLYARIPSGYSALLLGSGGFRTTDPR